MGLQPDDHHTAPPTLDYAGPPEQPPEPAGCLGVVITLGISGLLLAGGAVTAAGLSLLGVALIIRSSGALTAGMVFSACGGGAVFLGWLIHRLAFPRPPTRPPPA